MLCTPQNLVTMLVSRPPVIDSPVVRSTWMHLQLSLAAAASPDRRAASGRLRSSLMSASRTRAPSRSKISVRREAWRLLGGLAVIVATFVGVRALLDHSDDVARALAPNASDATSAGEIDHPQRLRASQAFVAAAGRPPLRVTADQARTVHRIGTSPYLYDGNRFFGVRFTFTNRGKHVWVSQPGTTYQLAGDSAVPRRGGSALRIREGRVLPDPIRLAPGHRLTGYVVFQVPVGEPMTWVSLAVGPGRPQTVSWRIDRQ